MNTQEILELIAKIDRLLALGDAVAAYMEAHQELTKKQFPDTLPPELAVDFKAILRGETK